MAQDKKNNLEQEDNDIEQEWMSRLKMIKDSFYGETESQVFVNVTDDLQSAKTIADRIFGTDVASPKDVMDIYHAMIREREK